MRDVTAEVIVVGSGPTGLVLGAELALAGVDVLLVDRRESAALAGSRAGGFHARTLELFEQRGIVDRFLAEGDVVHVSALGTTSVDFSVLPSRRAHTLGLWQNHIERILRGWVEELGVPVRLGVEVVAVQQDDGDDGGVDVVLADGERLRARWVVGADGGRSVVRRSVGIDFVGPAAARSHLIAEVEVTEETPTGPLFDEVGVHGLHVMEDGHTVRVVTTEREVGPSTDPTLADLSAALRSAFGTDFGVHDPTWLARFTDATRQAVAYRDRRVLLAGDAAHVHHPVGGQGIGLGVQDAVNLAWKLGQVVRSESPADLLDSYHDERHAAGARVLRYTLAQSTLQRSDVRTAALNELIGEALAVEGSRTVLAGLLSGLDVTYDVGPGEHPLLGRRVPDLDLVTEAGETTVFALLHDARPVLLDLAGGALADVRRPGRVRHVVATCDGPWDLPVVGVVPAPTGVLVRPDGHVVWVGESSDIGLREALDRWCGTSS